MYSSRTLHLGVTVDVFWYTVYHNEFKINYLHFWLASYSFNCACVWRSLQCWLDGDACFVGLL